MRALRTGVALLLALCSCTEAQVEGGSTTPSATSVPQSEPVASEKVAVLLQLPEGLHSKPVDGWVVDSSGTTVAEFQFEAAVLYERVGEGYSGSDFETTVTEAPLQISLELPGPGNFEFHVGAVEYFGGCGTCGRFHGDGGSVKATIVNGSFVQLDIGPTTAVS